MTGSRREPGTRGGTHPPRIDPIRVWIVEDNRFLRDTLVEVLDAEPDTTCTLASETCEAALDALEEGAVPHVVLMDLGLPGMSGLEGIRRIRAGSPTTEVIVLTVQDEDDEIFEALCSGACGYLLKPSSSTEITAAIRTALEGGAPINPFIARRALALFTDPRPTGADYGLTTREREILELLTEGQSQKRIAARLSLSPHTVDTHLRNIYGKLHVHSQTAAVAKAIQERLL